MLGFSWQSSSKCSSFTPLNSSAEGTWWMFIHLLLMRGREAEFPGIIYPLTTEERALVYAGEKINLEMCGDSYCILSVCLNHCQYQICLTWRLLSVVVTLSTSTLYEAKHLRSGVHLVVVVTGALL